MNSSNGSRMAASPPYYLQHGADDYVPPLMDSGDLMNLFECGVFDELSSSKTHEMSREDTADAENKVRNR
jgi:hypothetical protein